MPQPPQTEVWLTPAVATGHCGEQMSFMAAKSSGKYLVHRMHCVQPEPHTKQWPEMFLTSVWPFAAGPMFGKLPGGGGQ